MSQPKRVAAVITEYRVNSHAEVIVGKILEGYRHDGGEKPNMQLVSMYVDQFPKRDLSRGLEKKHGFKIYDTIAGALTLGGKDLAVEGVLCIGEHGNYPSNDKGQHLYPRRRFFEEVCKVFEKSGKSVPVFNDKHLSYSWENAKWMYDRARELHVPFMAGSSLPVTYRRPPLMLPRGCELTEAVQIFYGGLESYGFHGLECLQCMVERRKGFETGVKSVQALQGEAMWKEFDRGGWSEDLLKAAMALVPAHQPGDYRALTAKEKGDALYFVEYRDGFRGLLAMMNGWLKDADNKGGPGAFAGRLKGKDQPAVTRLAMQDDFPYAHFLFLVKAIDSMMQTGHPPYPVERTLLTTGVLDAAMTSLHEKGKKIDTPHLAIKYTPTDYPFGTGPEPKPIRR